MDGKTNAIIAILVSHLAIFLIQAVVRRWVGLGGTGMYGIYLMLLPLGFNCFGMGLPPLMVAGMVLAGLALLLWNFTRILARASAL